MESRRKKRGRTTSGGLSSTAPRAPSANSSALYANIEAVIKGGGQIMIGTVAPIYGAAVAHDGKKTLAMLKQRAQEPLADLLLRLDTAIANAKASDRRIDEINSASSKTRYEL